MTKITIHKPADLELVVIDGEPPVDQSALVASLQAELAAAMATITGLESQINSMQQKLNAIADILQG
jgi:hypothetical protein